MCLPKLFAFHMPSSSGMQLKEKIVMNRPTTFNVRFFCNLLNSYDIFVMRICNIIKRATEDKHCNI